MLKTIGKKIGNLVVGLPVATFFSCLIMLVAAAFTMLGTVIVMALAAVVSVILMTLPIISFLGLSDKIKTKVEELEKKAEVPDNVTEFKR